MRNILGVDEFGGSFRGRREPVEHAAGWRAILAVGGEPFAGFPEPDGWIREGDVAEDAASVTQPLPPEVEQ